MRLKNKIADLIAEPLDEEGFELVEIKLAQYKKQSRLQVFIDTDKGVTIDDCARASKTIAPLIDANELFPCGYIIEVSSPGLDRPLMTARDFRRRLGEDIRIHFHDNSVRPVAGNLVAADDKNIELETNNGRESFALMDVRVGKIIF